MHRAPGYKIDDYEAAMIKIATFASVESFWAVYSHLRRADQVPTITDYHMFRAGVRPVWEDSANVSGGKWMIRLRKGVSPRIWEKLAMAVVGDAFDVGDEICGIVLSIRNSEDIISLWNKTAIDHRTNSHIRDTMRQSMELPTDCIIQYKVHNDSLRDSSTFKASESFK
ncbi:translation initiation factor eIF 4e-like domain-containing protein [Coemansia spiralis]|nr:translation initiation factor eIF 4e-like domain-containing protein [Coemansia spiralis]